MNNPNRHDSESFITHARWLTIFGIPGLLWVYKYNISLDLLLITIVFLAYNIFLQFYWLKRNIGQYSVLLSFIDSSYLVYIYVHTLQGQVGMPQLFYFLILILGIRHGTSRYLWIVLISVSLYVWTTVAGTYYFNYIVNPFTLLVQVTFFTAFGIMSSYIFRKEYQQRLEKEQLISELQTAYHQLRAHSDQVEVLANTDPLTGLYNYRYFSDRLKSELEMSRRFSHSLSLVILDIDHFKSFNDTYGHPAGDMVLKEASQIFRQNIRDKDILCRYGGEEFLILLPSTGLEEAFKCAERIREAIEQLKIKLDSSGEIVSITVSGGVASFPLDAGSGDQLLKVADEVLYSAKQEGRNRIYYKL